MSPCLHSRVREVFSSGGEENPSSFRLASANLDVVASQAKNTPTGEPTPLSGVDCGAAPPALEMMEGCGSRAFLNTAQAKTGPMRAGNVSGKLASPFRLTHFAPFAHCHKRSALPFLAYIAGIEDMSKSGKSDGLAYHANDTQAHMLVYAGGLRRFVCVCVACLPRKKNLRRKVWLPLAFCLRLPAKKKSARRGRTLSFLLHLDAYKRLFFGESLARARARASCGTHITASCVNLVFRPLLYPPRHYRSLRTAPANSRRRPILGKILV